MSASNWAICPRCLARAKAEEARQLAEVMQKYGQIPVQEFDTARAAINPVDLYKLTTFREDYEIYGADQGIVHVSYDGSCRTCGLCLSFNDERPIPGLDEP